MLGKKLSVNAVTKLYTRRLFENVRYPKGKISEDAYIIMDILSQVDTAVFTPRTEYYYFHRGDSINTANYKEIDNTRIEAHKKNYEYIKEVYPEYVNLAYERYLGAVYFVAHKMVMSKVDRNISYNTIRFLKKNRNIIIKGKYFSSKRKMLMLIMTFNKNIYRTIVVNLKL